MLKETVKMYKAIKKGLYNFVKSKPILPKAEVVRRFTWIQITLCL